MDKRSPRRILLIALALLFVLIGTGVNAAPDKWIIARNSIERLPDDSLPGLTALLLRGNQAIYLRTAMSSDNELLVVADARLNDSTDVAALFPDRARPDGDYLVADFTAEEIRRLTLATPAGPDALPPPQLHPATLADTLALIRALGPDLQTPPTVIIEPVKVWLQTREDKDPLPPLIELLSRFGYGSADDDSFIANFDPEILQRLHNELLPGAGLKPGLIQLIDTNDGAEVKRQERGEWVPYNYDLLFTRFGLKELSGIVSVIGLPPGLLVDGDGGRPLRAHYCEDAHLLGLRILTYQADPLLLTLPGYATTPDEVLDNLLFTVGVDGIITRHPDLVHSFIANRSKPETSNEPITIDQLLHNLEGPGPAAEPAAPPEKPL